MRAGQPFMLDLSKIEDKIIVKNLSNNTVFTTLDGEEETI